MTDGPETSSYENDGTCGCRRVVVNYPSRRAVFSELDPTEQYFPMIAREEEQSFYGTPPEAMQPVAERPAQNQEHMEPPGQNDGRLDISFRSPLREVVYSDDENQDSEEQQQNRSRQENHPTRQEQEQEEIWAEWERESLQSNFDLFFSTRNLCASRQYPFILY